ncbi:MAG: acylphosphatase [Candidatus Omnitrophica bacterium]|nr:acylphosphatase [Candidatus Omnitrophota bacterium]
MQKRLHIYYTGSVQGVGFRFTVERTANSLGLFGWVKNLGDGRVEAVVEGEEPALESFRQKILDIFDGYIRQVKSGLGEATGEFGSFDIRF